MPTFSEMQLRYQKVGTVGQQLKKMSDDFMQNTFDNDISTRLCYIYDYYNDDQIDVSDTGNSGYDPSKSKTKTPVKLKFIIKDYKSAAKDDPEYHIQFEPDAWNNESAVPNYYKDAYGKFGVHFPIGLYVDIPDDKGVYWKWLIFYEEVANQFPKFGVLRCNYNFKWVIDKNGNRYIRRMWGIQRTQSSYNSGIYTYNLSTKVENQSKFWLPWNPISSELFYEQRIIISMPMPKPITYRISKVENTIPKGINQFTVYQDAFDETHDKNSYYDKYGQFTPDGAEMIADYYESTVTPTEAPPEENESKILKLTCLKYTIRANGGYKVIVADYYNERNEIITDDKPDNLVWKYQIYDPETNTTNDFNYIKTMPITDENNIEITNKIKVKIINTADEDYEYEKLISKNLIITCTNGTLTNSLSLDITV